jgi:HAD superfamily phosphoserine phosphatase-like hydrolase
MKLVVFDFCETIVSKQTANNFVNYILKDNTTYWSCIISVIEWFFKRFRIFYLFDILFPKFNFSKKINLLKIRGLPEVVLSIYSKKYYDEFIVNHFNNNIIEYLKFHLSEMDSIVVVVSGGYNSYLKIFCQEYNIKYLFSNTINCKNSRVTGFLKGKDCMFEEKVNCLNSFIEFNKLLINKKIVFTDSLSDLPLLKWSDINYVISYNKSQSWVSKYNFNEIINQRD